MITRLQKQLSNIDEKYSKNTYVITGMQFINDYKIDSDILQYTSDLKLLLNNDYHILLPDYGRMDLAPLIKLCDDVKIHETDNTTKLIKLTRALQEVILSTYSQLLSDTPLDSIINDAAKRNEERISNTTVALSMYFQQKWGTKSFTFDYELMQWRGFLKYDSNYDQAENKIYYINNLINASIAYMVGMLEDSVQHFIKMNSRKSYIKTDTGYQIFEQDTIMYSIHNKDKPLLPPKVYKGIVKTVIEEKITIQYVEEYVNYKRAYVPLYDEKTYNISDLKQIKIITPYYFKYLKYKAKYLQLIKK